MENQTTPGQPTAGKRNARIMIVAVALLFTAPMAVSWYMFHFADTSKMRGEGHGEMYQPLRPLSDAPLFDPFAEKPGTDHLHGKWTLLYINTGHCDDVCKENIYRMRQIRLAVIRYADRLQRVWMTDFADINQLKNLLQEYQGTKLLDINRVRSTLSPEQFALGDGDDPLQADHLYVIDPLGNLVLRYRMDTDPVGIIKDLRRLLRNSRIG
jgi:cytochrome oxidase Cu insertion factor (SCO1/SenC/PrrC family)